MKWRFAKNDSLPTQVLIITIIGQCVTFLLTVLLARYLSKEGFEAYVIASALYIMLVNIVLQGVDKYTQLLLPLLLEKSSWGKVKGYFLISFYRIIFLALIIGVVIGIGYGYRGDGDSAFRQAIVISCWCVPIGALAHFAFEVLTVLKRTLFAALVFRVVVPVVTLLLVYLLMLFSVPLKGALVIGCWGLSWFLALVIMAFSINRYAPQALWSSMPVKETALWIKETIPFWLYGISLTLLGQASVFYLEWFHPSTHAVGIYAAALGTANLVRVIPTATNRIYIRQFSLLLENKQYQAVYALRRKRLLWISIPLAVYLTVTLGFTQEILGFFRAEFIHEGVAALRLLSLTSAFTVLFSLSPTYLKFIGKNNIIYYVVTIVAIIQMIILLILVPALSVLGAAIAYTITMIILYGTLAMISYGELTSARAKLP